MNLFRRLWGYLLPWKASESSSVPDAVPTAEVAPPRLEASSPEMPSPARTIDALIDPETLFLSVQPDDLLERHLTAGVAEEYFDRYAARVADTIAEVYGGDIYSEKSVHRKSPHPCYHYSFSLEGVEVEFTAHAAGFSPTWDKSSSYDFVIYQLSLKIAEASLDKEKAGAFLRKLLKYSDLNCRAYDDEKGYLFLIFHTKGETNIREGVELLKELNVSLELTYEHGVVPRTVTPDYKIGTAISDVRNSGGLSVIN